MRTINDFAAFFTVIKYNFNLRLFTDAYLLQCCRVLPNRSNQDALAAVWTIDRRGLGNVTSDATQTCFCGDTVTLPSHLDVGL